MNNQWKIFFIFLVLVSLASASNIVDFCVADFNFPVGPAGYPCKDPTKVTINDFVYSGLAAPGNMSNIFNVSIQAAVDKTFPALNGLGISAFRADMGVGGAFPIHSHRVTEIMYILEGTVSSGFIGSDNKVYYKTLNKGDVMVVPPTLYHFSINVGNTPALIFVSFNSQNPGVHTFTTSIATNDLPTELIQKVTLLDVAQIKKLKKIFGGTN